MKKKDGEEVIKREPNILRYTEILNKKQNKRYLCVGLWILGKEIAGYDLISYDDINAAKKMVKREDIERGIKEGTTVII